MVVHINKEFWPSKPDDSIPQGVGMIWDSAKVCVRTAGSGGRPVESVPSGTKNVMGRGPWFSHEGRVPHISLVFGEMWDTTDVGRKVHRMNQSQREDAVVSHISPKTSEIWGTRPS